MQIDRGFRLLALLAAVLFLAAACGGDDDDTESDAGSEETADAEFEEREAGESTGAAAPAVDGDFDVETEAADDAAMDEAESEAEGDRELADGDAAQAPSDENGESPLGAGGVQVTPTAADIGRKLIFTAFLNVEVDDVAGASAEATSIIQEMGGFLFGQNTSGGAEASSELTFKVLPADFNRALERLGTVGELRNQSVTTDDVTERIVDLESRIQVAELGVERLRAALEGSATLEDYAEIERLLLDRESNLEVMRGQLRTLEDRVDLATITLLLTQDRVENNIDLRISTYNDHDGGESCPGNQNNSIEADSELTLCFEVVNVGDQTLTQIELTDTVLDIDPETALITVFGSADELAPGQSVLLAHEIKPERTLRLRPRVVAIPTDGVTSEQTGPSVSSQPDYEIRTFEPDRDPGFGDGFDTAVGFLKNLWIVLVVVLGFLIPLLVLLPFVWLAWLGVRAWRTRRPPRQRPQPHQPGGGPVPPPPGSPATPTADPSISAPTATAPTAEGAAGSTATAVADPPPAPWPTEGPGSGSAGGG